MQGTVEIVGGGIGGLSSDICWPVKGGELGLMSASLISGRSVLRFFKKQ
jgi:hypothetical protein